MTVKKGDKVKVEYEGSFDNEEIFDSSKGTPLEFEVGAKQVIKGFDDAVLGMKIEQEKTIKILPHEGYGERVEDLKKTIPRDQFPKNQKIEEGMMLGIRLPDGRQIPAIITHVCDKDIIIDMNHPMAGKVLNFKIKLVEIVAS